MNTTEHALKRRELLDMLDQAIALGVELNDLWDKNTTIMQLAHQERKAA